MAKTKTAADNLCERLIEWGTNTIYGFPGDGINGILGSLRRHQDQLRFIQTRHEEMASFMACGHAKFTGEVGVCMATSGPGAIHLLNGLYDAKLDHQPVVAIVGQTFVRALGGDFQQEVNLLQLYSDVASSWCQQVNTPSSVRHIVDRAFRIAQAERTVTCVIVPADVQDMEAVEEQPKATHTVHTGVGWWKPRVIPAADQLRQAADILNAGEKVAMLVGAGAMDATDEVLAVADALGAGVAKALLGKASVPDDVPYCTGSIGLLGTKPSWDMMQDADTLLMVGSSFPYSEFLPTTGQVKAVQIDLAPRMLSIRYPMDLALVGDAKDTLTELLPLLQRKSDRSWQDKIVGNVKEWWALMDDEGQPSDLDGRIRPQGLFASLSRHLPDQAILSSDSGTAADWYARHIRIRRGMKASLSGNLATMVPGVPYGMAAKFAFPDRVSVAMVGDGAMQMGGMAEMLTAAKYYKTWADPRYVRGRAQQRGPQPGDLGAAGHGGRPSLRRLPVDPLRLLRRLGSTDRTQGDQGHPLRSDRGGLHRGVRRRPARHRGRPDHTGRTAHAPPRHLQASPGVDDLGRKGPDRGPGRGQRGRTRDGPRVPAPRERLSMRRHAASITHAESLGGVTHVIDRAVADVAHGRFERSLAGLTAFAAAVTTSEIYIEHYKASFGNKMMWSPIIVTPPLVVAGVAGVFSKKWAKTALPVTAAIYTLNGLVGEYFHIRGVARKPGGFKLASYNLPMGPPISAPGLMSIVGGMGLLAALLRRED